MKVTQGLALHNQCERHERQSRKGQKRKKNNDNNKKDKEKEKKEEDGETKRIATSRNRKPTTH